MRHIRLLVLLWWALIPILLFASRREQMGRSIDEFDGEKGKKEYSFEVGAQIGTGYYIGDANSIPFVQPRYVIGAQLRYKMNNQRFAFQFKLQQACVAYEYAVKNTAAEWAEEITNPFAEQVLPQIGGGDFMEVNPPICYQMPVWAADVVCEFNFFKFGSPSYDYRIKTFTPYVFLGLGGSISNKEAIPATEEIIPQVKRMNAFVYVPLGVGVKWKFADRWQLQAAWQHQIYFSDNVDGYLPNIDFTKPKDPSVKPEYPTQSKLNNLDGINGLNILNNDLTSTLTIGVVFEFGEQRYENYRQEKYGISARIRRGEY